jgi:hypothetical protein
MKSGLFKKADIVLLVLLLLIGAAAMVYVHGIDAAGSTVIIESDGKVFAEYSITEDVTVKVPAAVHKTDGKDEAYNIVEIHDGKVKVTEATCHNQICVNHAEIDSAGESIICLPNKLIVKISGEEGYDAISN